VRIVDQDASASAINWIGQDLNLVPGMDGMGLGLNLPSGKHTKNYGKSPFLMGQLTKSMAMFNRYVYQRV